MVDIQHVEVRSLGEPALNLYHMGCKHLGHLAIADIVDLFATPRQHLFLRCEHLRKAPSQEHDPIVEVFR